MAASGGCSTLTYKAGRDLGREAQAKSCPKHSLHFLSHVFGLFGFFFFSIYFFSVSEGLVMFLFPAGVPNSLSLFLYPSGILLVPH